MNRNSFIKSLAGASAVFLLPGMAASSPAFSKNQLPGRVVYKKEGEKINVLGDNMTVKLTGDDTAGRYGLVEQFNDPGTGIPVHVHKNEDEVFKVLEGKVEFVLGDEVKILEAGDLVFCPRNLPHTWRVVGDTKARVDLGFFPAGLEKMFDELSQLPPGPPDLQQVGAITSRYGVDFV